MSGNTYTTGAISADCAVTASFAAAFTWIGGPDIANGKGSYGTQGVAAATNIPGPRDEAATWTDSGGNLWLFGGEGDDATGSWGQLSDLWKYSPSSGEWTWVGGSDTAYTKGVYGTRGVAAPPNMPGARRSAVCWTDANGDVWLYGGYGADSTNTFSYFNDLWEYSPSSNEWTRVGGATTVGARGVYGTEGVAATTNMPGARANLFGWTDAVGDFWLLGGEGIDSTGAAGWLNDVWEYSPSSGEWTWTNGSNVANAAGVCGSQGVAAAANMPGARGYTATWQDGSGNLWLFGGEGVDCAGGGGFLSDLWEYSPSSGEWTWIAGSKIGDARGLYGTQAIAGAANLPGARDSSLVWSAGGQVWLFGGGGYDSSDTLGDLWSYPTQ